MSARSLQDPLSMMARYWLGVARACVDAAAPFISLSRSGKLPAGALWDLGVPARGRGQPSECGALQDAQGPTAMPPWWPTRPINLVGDARIRGVALTRPTAEVAALLPRGVVLGTQTLTPPGTHPLVFFFSDFSHMRMSVPTLAPEMNYREEIIGVPFTQVAAAGGDLRRTSPAFYMVRLYLDRSLDGWLALVGGRLFWGYLKDPAWIVSSADRFLIHGPAGEPLIDLNNAADASFRAVEDFASFASWRQIQEQPLVTHLPLGIGPLCVISDYHKKWESTQVRPLRVVLDLVNPPLSGIPRGRFPVQGWTPGFEHSPLGGFEMKTRIRSSLPYPPWLSSRQ
jgi:hypothetical protein